MCSIGRVIVEILTTQVSTQLRKHMAVMPTVHMYVCTYMIIYLLFPIVYGKHLRRSDRRRKLQRIALLFG